MSKRERKRERKRLERLRPQLERLMRILCLIVAGGIALTAWGFATGSAESALFYWLRLGFCGACLAALLHMRAFERAIFSEITAESRPQDPNGPPWVCTFALCLLLRKQDREPLLGDLAEEFNEMRERFGVRPARVWYATQVVRSLWPLIYALGVRLLRAGVLGGIGQALWMWIQGFFVAR